MDTSGDQSDDQQASEKPIGIEEQKTIERQEAEEEGSTEDINELPATTTEEITGKAQEQGKMKLMQNKMSRRNQNQSSKIRLKNYLINLPNIFWSAN
jgi:hypothetical protein